MSPRFNRGNCRGGPVCAPCIVIYRFEQREKSNPAELTHGIARVQDSEPLRHICRPSRAEDDKISRRCAS
jgi:ferredoxin